ncbi:MAG TPA: TonB-dependent receptor [Thermoanaerobaculia bacterium]|nr:TonB-dependent receptor [Thermoanaerobaculia bacterium]
MASPLAAAILLLLLAGEPEATFVDTITVQETARPGVIEREEAPEAASAVEAAARLPGVVVEGDLGEMDRVLVRGAEARLVATTLDGERLPSPDGEARSAGLSLIPAHLLEEVAVSKTLTPDRDADAIGGTVDLVTRRAPESGLSTLELRGGAASGGPLYGGDMAFGRRLLKGSLGMLGAVTAESAERDVDGFQADWGDEGLDRSETRDTTLDRERLGALATFDLAPSESSALVLRGLFSRERTRELRRRVKDDFEEDLIERELKDAELWRELLAVSANGSRLLGPALLEASVGYNAAVEREPDRVDTSFVQEGVEFEDDPALFLLDKIGVEDNDTRERNLFAALDLSRNVLKAGVKVRDKSKQRDVQMTLFRPGEEIYLRDWAGREPMIDPERARRLLDSLGQTGQPADVEETADYRAAERTAASYVQAEMRIGRLTLLPGIRYEHTWSDYRGFELTTGLRPLRGETSYGVWLPMLHAGFELRQGLEAKAALTRGFARPDYFDLVPYRRVDAEDREIEEGNADLRATRSWNLDGRLDWRPGPGRSFGIGVFHRELTDFTFIRRGEVEIGDETWDSARPENGETGRLQGFELLARWRLPGEGFGVEASSTWTRPLAWTADGEKRLRLPGQVPWMGRLALSYERRGLAGELAFTWADPYVTELGDTREEDLFRDHRRRLDLALSYTFASGLRWRLEALNLTDDPMRLYAGDPRRPVQSESYGRSLRSGISFHF